jgi:hypothetical protein
VLPEFRRLSRRDTPKITKPVRHAHFQTPHACPEARIVDLETTVVRHPQAQSPGTGYHPYPPTETALDKPSDLIEDHYTTAVKHRV